METIHYLTALILGTLVIAIGYGAYSSVVNQTNQSVQNSIDDALETGQDFRPTSNTGYLNGTNQIEVCDKCQLKIKRESLHSLQL
jgi:hypothetical protein